jgi:hypothetical protein
MEPQELGFIILCKLVFNLYFSCLPKLLFLILYLTSILSFDQSFNLFSPLFINSHLFSFKASKNQKYHISNHSEVPNNLCLLYSYFFKIHLFCF